MITDGNERCRQRKLPSMPSHERKLYHPDDSDQEPRRDMNHMARWMPDEFGSGDKDELRSETRERRKWVNRVSELRTGGK
jgi:hypothetical protein